MNNSTTSAPPRPSQNVFRLTGDQASDSFTDARNSSRSKSIFLAMGIEWIRLCRLPSSTQALALWAQTEPILQADSLSDLLTRIDQADQATTDTMLLTLIQLAQGGNQLAGRVLLQAMLPKLARIVATFRQLNGADMRIWAERQQLAVTTFWTVIHTYPTRRTSKVAANLALETLHLLTDELRNPEKARRIAETLPLTNATNDHRDGQIRDDIEYFNGHHYPTVQAEADPATKGRNAATADLIELTTWGVEVDAITTAEAQLLIHVYLPHPDADRDPKTSAAARGLTPAALRKRCSRARQRLIDAVRDDAEGWAITAASAA